MSHLWRFHMMPSHMIGNVPVPVPVGENHCRSHLEDVRHLQRSGAARYQCTSTSWAMKVRSILCSAVVQHSILVVLAAAAVAAAAAQMSSIVLHEWLKWRDDTCPCASVCRHMVPDSCWLSLLENTKRMPGHFQASAGTITSERPGLAASYRYS